MTGPMCRAIGGRGDVIGMAFGAVGEASSSVLVHAKACADGKILPVITGNYHYGNYPGNLVLNYRSKSLVGGESAQ